LVDVLLVDLDSAPNLLVETWRVWKTRRMESWMVLSPPLSAEPALLSLSVHEAPPAPERVSCHFRMNKSLSDGPEL